MLGVKSCTDIFGLNFDIWGVKLGGRSSRPAVIVFAFVVGSCVIRSITKSNV